MMKSNLYVACATDRETLEFLKLLDQIGYRFPNGERLPVENMPRRDSRLPWALDTAEKTAAFTNPATALGAGHGGKDRRLHQRRHGGVSVPSAGSGAGAFCPAGPAGAVKPPGGEDPAQAFMGGSAYREHRKPRRRGQACP